MSISAKIGCAAQTLNEWVMKAEVDSGKRAGIPSDMAEKMKALERENRELCQAHEILRKASAYFAMAELERRSKCWCRSSTCIGVCMGRADLQRAADCPVHLYAHLAKRADPARMSDRAHRDAALRSDIRRVFEENWQVYGVRKV